MQTEVKELTKIKILYVTLKEEAKKNKEKAQSLGEANKELETQIDQSSHLWGKKSLAYPQKVMKLQEEIQTKTERIGQVEAQVEEKAQEIVQITEEHEG